MKITEPKPRFLYRTEKQEKLHDFLYRIYRAFGKKDYEKYKEQANRLIHFYTVPNYKEQYTFNSFKASVERWLNETYFKLSDSEIAAMWAVYQQYKIEKQQSDDYFIYCLSIKPKPQQMKPKEEKPERPEKKKIDMEDLDISEEGSELTDDDFEDFDESEDDDDSEEAQERRRPRSDEELSEIDIDI